MSLVIRKAWRSGAAIALGGLVTLASFAYSYNAKAESASAAKQTAKEVTARAYAFKAQNDKFRLIFCRFFEPYAANPTPPETEQAKQFKDGAKYAVGADGLACTPNPNDGQSGPKWTVRTRCWRSPR